MGQLSFVRNGGRTPEPRVAFRARERAENRPPHREGMPPMARLVGVDLPRDKGMEVALTYIYGVGRPRSNEILAAVGSDKDLRTKDLTDDQVSQRRHSREGQFKVEGE